jgi:hypothetical protein
LGEEMIVRNPLLHNEPLPVEVVFHPSWWSRNAGISFDADFFYHPIRRVEAERKMEQVLYDRFGDLGLGLDHDKNLPVIGAIHNAAGYLISEMLGCKVEYRENEPPAVIPAGKESLSIDVEAAFSGQPFTRLLRLVESLKLTYGYVVGDVNWGGILNLAMDLRGQDVLLDSLERPTEVQSYFGSIAEIVERFTTAISGQTGTTSISVNRTVRHIRNPVFLHSECALTMLSAEHYEKLIMPFDRSWCERHRPFGIHYCGPDPHRFADCWSKIPHLDFLDVGWGGDLHVLREKLPRTFLNIRLSPIEIVEQSAKDIRNAIISRVEDSGNPFLTGICCINMDDRVTDEKIRTIFGTVHDLRQSAFQPGT